MAKGHEVPSYNPIRVTLDGLSFVFNKAQSVALLMILIIGAMFILNSLIPKLSFTNDPTGKATERALYDFLSQSPTALLGWAAALIVASLCFLVIFTMLHGIASYTIAELDKGRKVTLRDAFNTVLENFGQYFIVYFIMNIKVVLWSLLFIVPGIIAYYRYSFAGVVFFDKDKKLRGDKAIQESNRLTKGGLLTIFASQYLFNIVTFFYADRIIALASQAVLYKEYTKLDEHDIPKPPAHKLSWLILLAPILLFILFVLFGAFAG